jgi:hypothetical protein
MIKTSKEFILFGHHSWIKIQFEYGLLMVPYCGVVEQNFFQLNESESAFVMID